MSNRVDLCRGEIESLSVPAGAAMVFVDRVLCPLLEVREIVRGGESDYGRTVMAYNPAVWAEAEPVAAECIETFAAMGKSVRVVIPYDAGFGRTQVAGWCIFAGQIGHIETTVTSSGESVLVTAFDFAARLERMTVYGQRVSDSLSLAGRATVFNAEGLPNASGGLVACGGREYRVFAADGRNGRYWTVAEAVMYLLNEYVAAGRLSVPDVEQLEGLFGGAVAGEINVDGLSVLEALEECCESTPVRFRFEACREPTGPDERIVFYRPGEGRKVELNLQRAGESLAVSRTNVCRLHSERRFWPVTQRYIGRGAWKVYEATFELIEAWDASLEGQAQSEYSPSTGSDFDSVRDVYRRWCLNEAGDYGGEALDFGSLFEGDEYAVRRRRFLKTASGYLLEVSCDGGQTWDEFGDSFEVLDAECGVWISEDALSAEMWAAIGADMLKFRMTAAVEGDQRLQVSVADGPVGSCAEVVDYVIDAPEYAYRRAVPTGVLVDDSAALHAYLRNVRQSNRAVIETIDVETAVIGWHWQCGDRVVCAPDSRDILGIRADSRSVFVIERVRMDLEKQCTQLRIIRRRM